MDIIKRINEMEKIYTELSILINEEKITDDFQNKYLKLKEYYESSLWLSDFEKDEKGLVPKDIKRGVLSEDGIYNLLLNIEEKLNER